MNNNVYACNILQKIEQNLYNNMSSHIQKKMIGVYSPQIRNRIREVAYDALPLVVLTNLDECVSTNAINKEDSMVVKDMTYGKSILCDGANEITYNLDGKYSYFTSYVSVCDVDEQ